MQRKSIFILLFMLCFCFLVFVPTSNAAVNNLNQSQFTTGTTYKVQDLFIVENTKGEQTAYVLLLDKSATYTVPFESVVRIKGENNNLVRLTYPSQKCYFASFIRTDENSTWTRTRIF